MKPSYSQLLFLSALVALVGGLVRIGRTIWAIVAVNWVMTTAGLVGYFIWNVLMIDMMIAIYRDAKTVQPIPKEQSFSI